MTPAVPREAISVQEAARLLSVHEDTIRNWHKRGIIELIRVGTRLWRVPIDEVKRLRRKPNNAN